MKKNKPTSSDRKTSILVVDDERDNRELMEIILSREGYLIQTAASGEDAMAAVARQAPDLILLDAIMTGISGYEVAAKLKADITTLHIAIIMVTALDDKKARILARDVGADDFLAKPMDRATLCGCVKSVLVRCLGGGAATAAALQS